MLITTSATYIFLEFQLQSLVVSVSLALAFRVASIKKQGLPQSSECAMFLGYVYLYRQNEKMYFMNPLDGT